MSNEIIEKLETIDTRGDIDMAIEYYNLLNEPLLTYEQYTQLRNHLVKYYQVNNNRVISSIEIRESRSFSLANSYHTILERLNTIQEEYEDDFI